MANIQLSNLAGKIAGFDLFNDSDSFMQDLSDNELDLQGGRVNIQTPVITAQFSIFCKRPRPMPTPPVFKI